MYPFMRQIPNRPKQAIPAVAVTLTVRGICRDLYILLQIELRYALALREELEKVILDPIFVGHVKDVIDYRTMDYYQRRYVEQSVTDDA